MSIHVIIHTINLMIGAWNRNIDGPIHRAEFSLCDMHSAHRAVRSHQSDAIAKTRHSVMS